MPQKLSQKLVEQLKPRPQEYVEWCAKLSGFGCRVRPSGAKSYIAVYRLGGSGRSGSLRKFTIGSSDKLSAEEARLKAAEVIAKASLGEDLAEERMAKKQEKTLAAICDEYLVACDKGLVTDSRGNPKKASTLATNRGRIDRHIKPLIGKLKITAIDRKNIEQFMFAVTTGRTAGSFRNEKGNLVTVRGGLGTAKRTVRLLGGILSYAVRQGYIEKNPRFGMKIAGDNENERFLSAEEFSRIGKVLAEAEAIGLPWAIDETKKTKHLAKDASTRRSAVDLHAIAAIRLLMLTGCRLREILHLRWADVDLQRGILNLPDSKTGKKNVILGRAAFEILDSLATLPDRGPFVIRGATPDKPRSDLKRPWERITHAAGLGGLRIHDLRHSFASAAADAGLDLLVIGKLLGHKDPKTTARYAHLVDETRARAADLTADKISDRLKGLKP